MGHLVRAVALALLVCIPAAAAHGVMGMEQAAAQVTPLDEEPREDPPGLGSIIGSPEAGPAPQDAGNRGGWAQLLLAVVLFGAVGIIVSRLIRASSTR